MRPWLVLKKAELSFEEDLIQLDVPGYKQRLRALSDAGTVPVLQVGDERIADSLAIAKWAAKCVPNLWPKLPKEKELAQAFCQRMQDDFAAFRNAAPMNLRRRTTTQLPGEAMQAAEHLATCFEELLASHDQPFLFGEWSIADAFATPYATRFHSYGIETSLKVDTYISELLSDEDYLEWEAAALVEPWTIQGTDEIGL